MYYLDKKEDEKNILANCCLVITDYKMPQMSGIDLIKKIREIDTNLKIKMMLISAFIKSDLILNNNILNSLSIDKIIKKLIHLETLKDEVQKLVRSTPLS